MEVKEESKMYYKNLSINISYYRKHRGLTQAQVVEYVGITSKYLSEIETPSKIRQCSLVLKNSFQNHNEFEIHTEEIQNMTISTINFSNDEILLENLLDGYQNLSKQQKTVLLLLYKEYGCTEIAKYLMQAFLCDNFAKMKIL